MKRISVKKAVMLILLLALPLWCLLPALNSKAGTASAITFGTIDYENLTLQVFNNNNTVVYYTTDKTKDSSWTELEAAYNSSTASYTMDISWVSATSDVTIYFKGDSVEKIRSITLPAQGTLKVTYNKSDGSFDFEDTDNASTFQWRKSADYNWHTVDLNEGSSTYTAFIDTMDELRLKGAQIVFRLPSVAGTGADNVGLRSSIERTVSVTSRATAPTVKVNTYKLTINTSTAMEYYDEDTSSWEECTSNMALAEVAPKTLYENGAKTVTLKIRKAATDSSPYSKTAILTIPGQGAAPSIGGSSSEVTHYILNSKLILTFNKASSSNIYQYCILSSSDDDFNASTASWRSVSSTQAISLSSTSAANGSIIYVRKKGTDATTKADAVLSTTVSSFTVTY